MSLALAGVLLAVGSGSAEAQEPQPVVDIGPGVANEASPAQPGLPCKPPWFFPDGYTGPCYLEFPLTVNNPGADPIEVTVAFEFGTADADDVKELPAPITLTVPNGPGNVCACVVIADDSLIEPDETIVATIVDASGAEIGQDSAVGTILDDELAALPPVVDVVASGGSSVTLGWDPVVPVRGTLAGYTVISRADGSPLAVTEQRVAPDVEHTSVAGLDPARTYTFTVRAETTDGPGAESETSGSPEAGGPAPGLADPPAVAGTTEGDGFVTVAWDPSSDDGGAPVVAYSVVALRPGDGSVVAWRNLAPDARQASVADLTNGEAVDVVVLVWNQVGPTAADAVTLTPAPGTAPEAPAASPYIQVDAHLGTATVTWGQAPEQGIPVLGYSAVITERIYGTTELVEWRNVGPSTRSAEFTGLDLCFYDVHVVAHGSTGFGTPAARPDLVLSPGENGGQVVCLNP